VLTATANAVDSVPIRLDLEPESNRSFFLSQGRTGSLNVVLIRASGAWTAIWDATLRTA
jgi:hypothetical protein